MSLRSLPSVGRGFRTTPIARRLARYSMVSVISLALSEALLVFFNGGLQWSAVWSSTAATGLATIPAYFLNRQWVWSRHGRSHLRKEVAPFWLLAVIGWAFATYSVKLAESAARHHHLTGSTRVALIAAAYVLAYGVLWLGRFIIFERLVFAHRPEKVPRSPVEL